MQPCRCAHHACHECANHACHESAHHACLECAHTTLRQALTKAFIPTSLAIMKAGCHYLEVGKNNIWSELRMAASASGSPFHLIAADYQSAQWTHTTLSELTEKVCDNKVRGQRTRARRERTQEGTTHALTRSPSAAHPLHIPRPHPIPFSPPLPHR